MTENMINKTNFLEIVEQKIYYNVIYYYYGTPKLCINLGYCENKNDAKQMQTAFQILNFHKNIVIEISDSIIGDEIICNKLIYPKRYGKNKYKYEKYIENHIENHNHTKNHDLYKQICEKRRNNTIIISK
jgi:hypothetical protein